MTGQDAREQARRGAGVAEIEHVARLLAAADAEAADPPHAVLLDNLRATDRRTTAVIATHRYWTARRADLVVVLEAGLVAEVGSPSDLDQDGTAFRALFAAQIEPD